MIPPIPALRRRRAARALARGRAARAARLLAPLAVRRTACVPDRLAYIDALERCGAHVAARSALARWCAEPAPAPALRERLAEALTRAGAHREAAAHWAALIQAGGASPDAAMRLGVALHEAGDPALAEGLFSDAFHTAEAPELRQAAWRHFAAAAEAANDMDTALDRWRLLAAFAPLEPGDWLHVGTLAARLGNADTVAEARAHLPDPDDRAALDQLLAETRGAWREAERAACDRLALADPADRPDLLRALMRYAARQGRDRLLLAWFHTLRRSEPALAAEDPAAFLQAALALKRLGRRGLARRVLFHHFRDRETVDLRLDLLYAELLVVEATCENDIGSAGSAAGDASKEDRSGEDRSGEDRAMEDKAEEDRAEQDRAEEDRPRQDGGKKDRAKEDRAKEDRAEEDRAKEDRRKGDRSGEHGTGSRDGKVGGRIGEAADRAAAEAAAILSDMDPADPRLADPLLAGRRARLLATLASRRGAVSEAAQLFRTANLGPASSEATSLQEVAAWTRLGDVKGRSLAIRNGLARFPESAALLAEAARFAEEEGDWASAASAWGRHAELAPGDRDATAAHALALLEAGRPHRFLEAADALGLGAAGCGPGLPQAPGNRCRPQDASAGAAAPGHDAVAPPGLPERLVALYARLLAGARAAEAATSAQAHAPGEPSFAALAGVPPDLPDDVNRVFDDARGSRWEGAARRLAERVERAARRIGPAEEASAGPGGRAAGTCASVGGPAPGAGSPRWEDEPASSAGCPRSAGIAAPDAGGLRTEDGSELGAGHRHPAGNAASGPGRARPTDGGDAPLLLTEPLGLDGSPSAAASVGPPRPAHSPLPRAGAPARAGARRREEAARSCAAGPRAAEARGPAPGLGTTTPSREGAGPPRALEARRAVEPAGAVQGDGRGWRWPGTD